MAPIWCLTFKGIYTILIVNKIVINPITFPNLTLCFTALRQANTKGPKPILKGKTQTKLAVGRKNNIGTWIYRHHPNTQLPKLPLKDDLYKDIICEDMQGHCLL